MNRKNSSRVYGRARYLAFFACAEIISCQPAFELSDGFSVGRIFDDNGLPIDPDADQVNSKLSISVISPSSGPVTGNQQVAIKGTGFSAGITVQFGSKSASPVEVLSDTELNVTLPAHLNSLAGDEKPFGATVVQVRRGNTIAPGKFTYVAADIKWNPAVILPTNDTSYQGPTLLQIHNNIDGHGQTGIIIGKEKSALAGVAWRWSDGTFDHQYYSRPGGVGNEAPGGMLGFSFGPDPMPDIFLTINNALYQFEYDVGTRSFKPAKRIPSSTKANGLLAVAQHNLGRNMVLVDDSTAYIIWPDNFGVIQSRNKFSLPSDNHSKGIVAANFNADNLEDLALLGQDGKADGYVAVFFAQSGRGDFNGPANYRVGKDPRAIVVTDVNADGRLDLVVAITGDKQIGVLLGQGDGTFLPVTTYPTGGVSPVALRAGDLNGDGFPELVFLNQGEDGFCVLRNQGSEGFDLLRFRADDTAGAYRGLDLGDVDQDRQLDLVLTGYEKNKIQLVLNKSLSRP